MIATLNVTPKVYSRKGVEFRPENTQGVYNAETGKASVRIFGHCSNRITPMTFDRTFKVGDEAEYGSYNLKYTGRILAIGPKTVKIDASCTGDKVRSLDLFEFIDRNWDFDAEKMAKHNAEEARCL